MTNVTALAAADRVLALINSQPRTPTREAIAAAIAADSTAQAGPLSSDELKRSEAAIDAARAIRAHRYLARRAARPAPEESGLPVKLSAEGHAFVDVAEWQMACARSSRRPFDKASAEAFSAETSLRAAAQRVWGRPAEGWGDVVARMIVAAYVSEPVRGRGLLIEHITSSPEEAAGQLFAAVERVSGVRRLQCNR